MSTGPRNRPGFARGQRAEAAIYRAHLTLQQRSPFEHITAKDIRRILPAEHRDLSCSAINRHLRHIRAKAAVAAALITRAPRAFIESPMALENSAMTAPIYSADEEPSDGRPPR